MFILHRRKGELLWLDLGEEVVQVVDVDGEVEQGDGEEVERV